MSSDEDRKSNDYSTILSSILKQVITLSVAALGFLFAMGEAMIITPRPIWLYNVALFVFAFTIIVAFLGQVALIATSYENESKCKRLPKFLYNPDKWFYLAWIGFIIGGGFVIAMVLKN